MRQLVKYLILVGGAFLTVPNGRATASAATFESGDGRTILLIADGYYYLGPKNHPVDSQFLMNYGQKVEYRHIREGKCLVLGVFKIAVINVNRAICEGVEIRKTPLADNRRAASYIASCSTLNGTVCGVTRGNGIPALEYGYRVDPKRGITHIYLSSEKSRGKSNTLVLKSGALFLK